MAMPNNSNVAQETLSETRKVIDGSGQEKPRKTTSRIPLRFRNNPNAEQRRNLTKHIRLSRSRYSTTGSAQSQIFSRQGKLEEDENDDTVEEVVRWRPAGRRQYPTKEHSESETSTLLAAKGSGVQLAKKHTHGCMRAEFYHMSPITVIGPGSKDPFSALPSDLPRKFIDERLHAIPEILANMVSRAYSAEAYGKSWAMDIMSTMASNTALFYAVMFGELMHTRVLRGIAQGSTMELEIGTRAIQHICHEIGDPNRAVLDSTIWAVVILGYSGRQAPLRLGSKYPRQSFLRELQSIHVYCKMEIVLEHVLGLIRLVNLVGGLQNIKTRGMAQVISFCGIMGACRTLQKPIFPFLAHSNNSVIDGGLSVSDEEHEWAMPTIGRLGTGFLDVCESSTAAELHDLWKVIQQMCEFTIIVENHVQGRWTPRTFTMLIDQRNFVQHSLMSLKTKQELYDNDSVVIEPLYECCRLAVIVYSFLVIFPIPPVAGPFEALAQQLGAEFTTVNLHDQNLSTSKLLLWVLMMGAIAAIGLPERRWFLSHIQTLSAHMGIAKWEEMKEILQLFLWLPSTSDPDGRDVYIEMQEDALSGN